MQILFFFLKFLFLKHRSVPFISMKKNFCFCLFLTLWCLSCSTRQTAGLKVMSFNIRYDNPQDSLNNWAFRKNNAGTMLNYYAPDIIGMQEVLHNQLTDLKNCLPDYTALGVGREDGQEKGEYSALFFKTERFDLLQSGNFSLSETPDKIGVKGWDAACERIATWGILRDKQNGKEFLALNTHLDHMGHRARREGARLILNKIKEISQGRPFLFTGDFNATPESEVIKILLTEGKVRDARQAAPIFYGPSWTFHDFGRLPLSEKEWIDYIFVSPEFSVEQFRNISDIPDEGFLSDHNPVYAEINF